MCEGYVRDPDHPSHPEPPLYKGFSDENVRDGHFSCMSYPAGSERFLGPIFAVNEEKTLELFGSVTIFGYICHHGLFEVQRLHG